MTYTQYLDDLETPITDLAAARFGSREAIRTSSEFVTFKDLSCRVDETWSCLWKEGVREGQAVALLADGSLESLLLLLALIERGAVAFPLPLRYPDESLVAMCKAAGASTLIRPGSEEAEKPGESLDQMRVLFGDELAASSNCSRRDGRSTEAAEKQRPSSPDRTVLGVHTSGSSGAPKAAALTYANLIFSALGANRMIRLQPGDRWLLTLPLYHVGGLGILFRCLLAGACVSIPDDPREIVRSMKRLGATHLSLVPTQLRRVLSDPDRDEALPGLKSVLVGGAATPDDLIDQALGAGLPLQLTYGLTEMGSQVATSKPRGARPNSLSVLPFRSVRIKDGAILVRGETLFAGYVVDGHVKSAVDEAGWYHSGDMGDFDRDARLVVSGRIDDMFISGGENIHPGVIEAAANKIDGIDRSLVVSVRDAEYGERPVLFVQYSSEPLAEADVIGKLGQSLPSFMLPIAVLELPEIDELPLGKVSRRRLQGFAYNMLQEKGLSGGASNR